MRDLSALPKGHLHVHLDAAARPETIIELARDQGVAPPRLSGFTNFDEFIKSFFALLEVTSSPAALRRVIDESVADAKRDGVRYLELGINPAFRAEVFGSVEAALETILDQGMLSAEKHGVSLGFNLTIDRMAGYDQSIATARLAAHYADRGITTIGLANEERGFPVTDFRDAFRIARDAGLGIAPHAGELVGPESVRSSLEVGSTRIQHGVRAVEDPRLIEKLADEAVCLDVCPTSNVVLGVYESIENHPLPQLLEAGVRCSINADDPTLFANSVTSEYELGRSTLGLSDHLLAACAWASIDCSAAPEDVKAAAKRDIDGWLTNDL
ncbi:adenosine deaminase [Paenarthrobacter sp. NPDC091711]|uniref:adenosine deaminase n=1 Tax=Paenarthrobacter sp. NPDC091711 TaxID=3364385 RepID=UPI00381F6271